LGASETARLESQRADAAEAEAQSSLMERDALRDEVAKFSEPAMGVLLELLVPNGKADALKKKGVDSLVTSVKAMDPESRQHWDYTRASNLLLDGVLEVCAGGDQERVQMLRGNAVEHFQKLQCRAGESWLESEEASAFRRVEANVIVAWRAAKKSSDVGLARQILSLVASRRAVGEKGGRYSQSNIADMMSELLPVNVSDRVRVLPVGASRNSAKLGVCVAVHAALLPDGSAQRNYDIAPVVVCGRSRSTSDFLMGVPESRVRHADSLVCTVAEVQAAADHGADLFPGAAVPKRTLAGWTRMPLQKKEITAAFLRCPSVVRRADGGKATAKKGVKWLLTVGRSELLRRLNKLLERAQQTP
jgi:hypothetical protein